MSVFGRGTVIVLDVVGRADEASVAKLVCVVPDLCDLEVGNPMAREALMKSFSETGLYRTARPRARLIVSAASEGLIISGPVGRKHRPT